MGRVILRKTLPADRLQPEAKGLRKLLRLRERTLKQTANQRAMILLPLQRERRLLKIGNRFQKAKRGATVPTSRFACFAQRLTTWKPSLPCLGHSADRDFDHSRSRCGFERIPGVCESGYVGLEMRLKTSRSWTQSQDIRRRRYTQQPGVSGAAAPPQVKRQRESNPEGFHKEDEPRRAFVQPLQG